MLMEEKKTTPKKWKRILLTILCLILALVLIVLVFTFAFVNRLLNQMNRVDPNKESAIASSALEQLLATDPDLETIQPDSTETLPHISDLTFPTEPPETELEQGGSEDTGSSVVEGEKEEAPAPAPNTKKCPYCCTEIAIEATRCPHCTSQLGE